MNPLFDDFERGALTVPRCGTVQHRADGMNRLTIATNNSTNIALTKLDFKDRHFATRNFREHHVVRKFDQLANDELEKFFHGGRKLTTNGQEWTRNFSCRLYRRDQLAGFSSGAAPAAGIAGAFAAGGVSVAVGSGAGASAAGAASVFAAAGSGAGAASVFAPAFGFAAFFASVAAIFFAAASGFLFFLIKLRTVSEGCAPLLIQY